LTTNVTVQSLTLNTGTRLQLAGYTLTVSALTVTGTPYKAGTYTTNQISLLVDSVGGGKVIVWQPPRGTVFRVL